MRRRHVLAFTAVLVGAFLLPATPPASGVAPGNDEITGATVLGPAPFHVEQSTVEATTSADEAAWNDFCGAPALEQGVWFTATPTVDAHITVEVTASDFSAGILVLTGEPGSLTPVFCSPGVVSGPVTAGQTIYLLVFGDGLNEQKTSGNLVLDTYLTPPPPAIAVTIDPRGTVDKEGVAHVSGTVSCSSDDPTGVLFDVTGTLRQRVGRGFVEGSINALQLTACDGVTRAWNADVIGDGTFAGGRTATAVVGFGCDTFSCGEGYAESVVKLSRRAK
jgi:hypothetical protein